MKSESAPPGWSGTVTAMRLHHNDEIENPWALAWWMKKKGEKPHYKKTKDDKSTGDNEPKKKKGFKEWLEERENAPTI